MTRRLRVFSLAFALIQICLQGLFAVSDGYAERASSHIAPVHTEPPGNHHHRLHDDDCVVCHVLAAGADLPQRERPTWLATAHVPLVPAAVVSDRTPSIVDGAQLPRAPPLTV
ncbi:MAG TPA: DUF2946 family protein [Gemmatimonadaceae bacterium]